MDPRTVPEVGVLVVWDEAVRERRQRRLTYDKGLRGTAWRQSATRLSKVLHLHTLTDRVQGPGRQARHSSGRLSSVKHSPTQAVKWQGGTALQERGVAFAALRCTA